MAPENHKWTPSGHLPVIRPHSLAKHRVIESYLRRYVEVLTSNPRIPEFYLTLVDGFAGGGMYQDETGETRPGSPLIMLRAMTEAAQLAQKQRSKDFNLAVEYFFIEQNQDAFRFLQTTLGESPYRHMVGQNVECSNESFTDKLPEMIERIAARGRGDRAIFLLDQFGYKDVPMGRIQEIFARLSHPEVILTFATDALINYLSINQQTQEILCRVGLEIKPERIATLKQEQDWRRAIQILLHREIHLRSGAKFYTPFFIRSPEAHRDFWLIHLSGAARARDVMVSQHWKENTSFAHYGRSGLQMLGYDPSEDFTITNQRTLPGFFFDESAQASTHQCLLEELPQRLFLTEDQIQFDDFFAATTNETPASSNLFKSVLADLANEGLVEIRGKNGEKRKRGIQHGSDIIIKPKQKKLIFLE